LALVAVTQAISWVFTVEIALKILGCESRPWVFFRSNWNCFDLLIVATIWFPYAVEGSEGLAWVKVIRLMRLFRVARFLKVRGRKKHEEKDKKR